MWKAKASNSDFKGIADIYILHVNIYGSWPSDIKIKVAIVT